MAAGIRHRSGDESASQPSQSTIAAGLQQIGNLARSTLGQFFLAILGVVAVGQILWIPKLFGKKRVLPEASIAQGVDPLETLAVRQLEIGPLDAPIQIEAFSDFQCPICRTAHATLMELLKQYKNRVHVVHRDYPLDQACNRMIENPFHDHACQAAWYARCAAKANQPRGSFWAYGALLFEHQDALSRSALRRYAKRLNLDPNTLAKCAKDPNTRQAVLDDIERGIERGVEGTPTFFVNGERVVGPRDMDWWENKLNRIVSPSRIPVIRGAVNPAPQAPPKK